MSVVTVEQYRTMMQDNSTPAPDIQVALDDAIELVEGYLNGRILTEGTYTETLPVFPRGQVYPRAVPVSSVSASATYQIHPEKSSLLYVTPDSEQIPSIVSDGWFNSPEVNSFSRLVGPVGRQVHDFPLGTVTYVGGFTSSTLPYALRRAICLLAQKMRAPSGSGYQPGVRMARVGDVQTQYTADATSGELDSLVPGLNKLISRWKLDR